jgi:hypothetical protein
VRRGSELLFLGYSLSDWNVRSFFNNVIKKRNEKSVERAAASTEEKPEELQPYPDYAVMNRFTVFDRAFFLENDISILHVDLGEFARHLGLALDAEDKRRP